MMLEDPKHPMEPSKTSLMTPSGAKCIKSYIQSIYIYIYIYIYDL